MAKKTPTRKSRSTTTESTTYVVTEHRLVPKHEICTQEEKKDLLSRFGVLPNQLPRINAQDPAIRHLGVKQGDVIKITRASDTAGESIFFRIVASE